MIFNVHAGHNPDGKAGCGAVGFLKESTQNRIVKDHLITILRGCGHTVYDCTVEDGKNARDVLEKIVAKCNAHDVDLDISIHHNAFKMDNGDGRIKGSEVYVYSKKKISYEYANSILYELTELGFTDRGVQEKPGLYVLKHTKAPALLVECCFIDDADDLSIYSAWDCACACARALAGASAVNAYLSGKEWADKAENEPPIVESDSIYAVQIGAFQSKESAERYAETARLHGYPETFVYKKS